MSNAAHTTTFVHSKRKARNILHLFFVSLKSHVTVIRIIYHPFVKSYLFRGTRSERESTVLQDTNAAVSRPALPFHPVISSIISSSTTTSTKTSTTNKLSVGRWTDVWRMLANSGRILRDNGGERWCGKVARAGGGGRSHWTIVRYSGVAWCCERQMRDNGKGQWRGMTASDGVA